MNKALLLYAFATFTCLNGALLKAVPKEHCEQNTYLQENIAEQENIKISVDSEHIDNQDVLTEQDEASGIVELGKLSAFGKIKKFLALQKLNSAIPAAKIFSGLGLIGLGIHTQKEGFEIAEKHDRLKNLSYYELIGEFLKCSLQGHEYFSLSGRVRAFAGIVLAFPLGFYLLRDGSSELDRQKIIGRIKNFLASKSGRTITATGKLLAGLGSAAAGAYIHTAVFIESKEIGSNYFCTLKQVLQTFYEGKFPNKIKMSFGERILYPLCLIPALPLGLATLYSGGKDIKKLYFVPKAKDTQKNRNLNQQTAISQEESDEPEDEFEKDCEPQEATDQAEQIVSQ